MFTIVTHHTPDLDAIASVWMIKKFLPNWQEASIAFVPAGETLNKVLVDSEPHILHVDTGLGKLDHHQVDDTNCAAQKVFQYIKTVISQDNSWHDEALERMSEVVNFYDHFQESLLPDATADYHVFDAVSIVDGLKAIYSEDDQKIMDLGFEILEAIYKSMQEKVWAEEIITKEGIKFTSHWGKAIAFNSLNDTVVKLSQKQGFIVAVRLDPHKHYVRIKGLPGTEVDFTSAYEILKQKDPDATWYLHPSKKILLNGSTKNPDMKPTKLMLDEIIDTLKNPNS